MFILKYKTWVQNTWQIAKDVCLLGVTTIVNSDGSTMLTWILLRYFTDFTSYVTEMRERPVMKIFFQNEFINQFLKHMKKTFDSKENQNNKQPANKFTTWDSLTNTLIWV